jgi:hypothetical protein
MSVAGQTRQFVITNWAEAEYADWTRVPLPGGWTLHHHPAAEVAVLRDGPEPVIRIGQAFCVGADGRGAGRYATIEWPLVAPDAGALLALHYGVREGRAAVSSSARLAAEALDGTPRRIEGAAPLRCGTAFNYIPAPGTPYVGVHKLFHDQAFRLTDCSVTHRASPIAPLASYDAALGALAGELVRFAEELGARTRGKVWLPLTAGLDSRTLAAAFLAADLPFEAVTFTCPGKPRSDIDVARTVCRRVGIAHHTLRLAAPDPGRAARIAAQIDGAALGWDHTHVYPGGGYDYLAPGDAMAQGACFEIGRQLTGETRFRGVSFDDADGADVWRRRADGDPAPAAFAGFLDEWIAWRRAYPLRMDFASAFYLDQRLGGWRASMEHGYDLLPGVSVSPANSALVYSAMITPDPADQREGRLQKDMIRMLAPELMAFPLNPPPLRQRLGKLRRSLAGLRLPGFGPEPLGAGRTLGAGPGAVAPGGNA